jgi:hypothetical protein
MGAVTGSLDPVRRAAGELPILLAAMAGGLLTASRDDIDERALGINRRIAIVPASS